LKRGGKEVFALESCLLFGAISCCPLYLSCPKQRAGKDAVPIRARGLALHLRL